MKLRSTPWLLLSVAAAGVLTFADQAPALAKAVLAGGRRVNQALERRAGLDWFSRSDLPFEGDTIGHFVLWVGLTVVAARALRSASTPALVGLMGLAAVGSELLQGIITSSREPSTSDLMANLFGVGVAAGFLLLRDLAKPQHAATRR